MNELVRLAVPMIVSRAGLAALGITDAIMVARHDPTQFAMLSLADGTFGRLNDVFAAFVLGGLILVPRAFGAGDLAECARIWRRTLRPSIVFGSVAFLLGLLAGAVFAVFRQRVDLASGAGAVAAILGAGSIPALVALAAAVFLEGVKRPKIVAAGAVLANLLNVGLNWLLIGGHAGLPALGARGSAISTTIVRFVLATALACVVARIVARAPAERAADPAQPVLQRRLGISSAIIGAVMLLLTASLTVFAGRLGPLHLAALAATFTLNAPVMLFVLGMADATGIRVATRAGEAGASGGSGRSARSVVLASLAVAGGVIAIFVAAWCTFPHDLAKIFTHDPALALRVAALIPLASALLVFDGTSFVTVSALRSLRDVVWPTAIELATLVALVPTAAWLAFRTPEGVRGLLIAAVVTAGVRAVLLVIRFAWMTAGARTASAP